MDFKKDSAASNGVLSLDGDLTIQRAAEIRELMMESLSGVDSLMLCISGVTSMDMSFLQLLFAVQRHAIATKKRLGLEGESLGLLQSTADEAGMDLKINNGSISMGEEMNV